jgi:dUTPase
MEIKIKQFKEGKCPKIIRKGDWIDLYTAEDVEIKGPIAGTRKRVMKKGVTTTTRPVTLFNTLIPLNVAMKLPDGCEAHLLPRSSTFIKHGIIMANSMGIIDETYQGDNDEWKFIINQRLGAINAEYDLLNVELQNEKRRVRTMRTYNVILVVLLALLSVAFVFLKRYKRDITEKDIDIVKHKERFNVLFEKHKSDYNLDRGTVMTEAMQNLERLHEAYPSLTRTDVSITWLLFMNCSTDKICELLNITHNYYYQRKSAIYRTFKINGKDSGGKAIEKVVRQYFS